MAILVPGQLSYVRTPKVHVYFNGCCHTFLSLLDILVIFVPSALMANGESGSFGMRVPTPSSCVIERKSLMRIDRLMSCGACPSILLIVAIDTP